jgi:hypothetical protein
MKEIRESWACWAERPEGLVVFGPFPTNRKQDEYRCILNGKRDPANTGGIHPVTDPGIEIRVVLPKNFKAQSST